MRSGLLLLLIGLPGAALAAEDRYGPSRAPVPAAAVVPVAATAAPASREPTDYRGQTLSWAGKPVAAAPQPIAPPVVAPQPALPQPAPVRPAAPPPQAYAAHSPDPAALPTSLYDTPAPVLAPAAAPPPPTPPAATAWPQQATLPPPPSTPPLAGTPSYGYSPPRSYSVVREWGGTPDRIPTPPSASQFSGREVALDPGTLGAPQQPDLPSEDEADEEQPQQRVAKQPTKGSRQ